jgi:molecular chaperone DnaJ
MRDYYEILGVSRNASPEEIKQAYRNLARQYHPDVAENKEEAERRFKEINEAFSVLSNPEKRAQYDRFGHAAFSGTSFGQDFGFDFSVGFDVFDDLIGAFFGETRRNARRESRGSDVRVDVEITLEEAYTGVSRQVEVQIPKTCEDCGGRGASASGVEVCFACRGRGQIKEVHQSFFGRVVRTSTCRHCHGTGQVLKEPCKTCKGSGRVSTTRKLSVEIPAGIEDGSRIRLRGEGEAGLRGAPAGDLYVFVHVKPHPYFKREGEHIYYTLPITFPEAVLGNEVEVPTLDGKEKLQIPPGTSQGEVLRLKGKGMPALNGVRRGDQYVIIELQIPKKVDEKQKQLLLELAKLLGVKMQSEKGFMGRLKDALGG